MAKKVIIGIIAFFVITTAVTFWIFSTFSGAAAEASAKTEADFTTEHFVVTELWKMQKKKGTQEISSYLFMKVKNDPIHLRLPWEGLTEDQETLANKINDGDTVEVKVLKAQLADARAGGALKAINRFIMGDKREVTIYKLSVHNQLLVDKDIHGWDEAKITLLGRLVDNPLILLIVFIPLMVIASYIRKRRESKAKA